LPNSSRSTLFSAVSSALRPPWYRFIFARSFPSALPFRRKLRLLKCLGEPPCLNAHVRRWLDEIANARVHGTTKAVPAVRLPEERAVMLPAPALEAPPNLPTRVAMPVESLQHPLAVYDELIEVFA
jgi:hypothetical protein